MRFLYWFGLVLYIFLLIIFNIPDILSYFSIVVLTSIYFILFFGGDSYE